jgi:glycine hydroxymethyltransferase
VALGEALRPEFKDYGEQIVRNSRALAASLLKEGQRLVTGGSDNHLILIDLTQYGTGKGVFVQEALDMAGITTNKNTIPAEPSSPFYPSGLRIGTPALTTRGMKEKEMEKIGRMLSIIINESAGYELGGKDERQESIRRFREDIKQNLKIKDVRKDVIELCEKFPLYETKK